MKWLLSVALLMAVTASAEMRQDTYEYIGISNSAAAVLTELTGLAGSARGELERISVKLNGSNRTNQLIITDGDGYLILSNGFTSGTTTTWYNLTNLPFIGIIVKGFNAVTATNAAEAHTNTIKILYKRE
jgi:hypothetical protein